MSLASSSLGLGTPVRRAGFGQSGAPGRVQAAGDNWYEQSGLTFTPFKPGVAGGQTYQSLINPAAGGAPHLGVTVPEFAAEDYDTPEQWYQFVQGVDVEDRPEVLGDLRSTWQARQQQIADRDASVASLDAATAQTTAQRDAFQNDPVRQKLLEVLMGRSAPDARVFSQVEENKALTDVAGAGARNRAAVEAALAASGNVGSGLGASADLAERARTARGGQEVSANVARLNQEARDRALSMLSEESLRAADVNLGFENLIAGLMREKAATQSSLQYEPTSHLPYAQLDFAREMYDTELQQMEEENARYEKESAFDGLDLFDLVTRIPGTGLADFANWFV